MRERCCPICRLNSDSQLFAESTYDAARLDGYAFASRKLPEYMHYRLFLCRSCDLIYANPAPESAALSQAYAAAQFDSQTQAILAARTYARLLNPILAELPDRCGALDIGTGEGAFLQELLTLGFRDVQGIEPSTAPISAANSTVRPMIRQGLFERGMFQPNSLALITCFQTIEHVLDPSALCEEVFRLLKPGGAFFLVGHNRRALSARLLGRRSPIFDLEHMQLFSPRSVRKMLALGGFVRIHGRAFWNRYPLDYWTRLFPLPPPVKTVTLAALKKSLIGNLQLSLPAGNLSAFGFRP